MPYKMKEQLLSEDAKSLVKLFHQLLYITHEKGSGFDHDLSVAVEDQQARFNIWAGNAGTFANGHASLDHRLRDSNEAKQLIFKLFADLQRYIQLAIDALKSTGVSEINRQDGLEDKEGNSGKIQLAISTAFSQCSASDIESEVNPNSLSPFEQWLQEIEDAIDRLHRVVVSIRKPSFATQNHKATKFVARDEEGNEIIPRFECYAFDVLQHKFRNASPALLRRLSKAISLRRRRFLYRQKHQQKLSKNLSSVLREQDYPNVLLEERGSMTINIGQSPSTTKLESSRFLKGTKTLILSETSASAFPGSKSWSRSSIKASSQTSIATYPVSSQRENVQVPLPPKLRNGSKEFECPYCCLILPIKETAAPQWRSHVMKDLEPYVCLFESCTEDSQLFVDKASWYNHMQQHAIQWCCNSPSHRPLILTSEGDFEGHMRSSHDENFTEAQLQVLKERSAKPAAVNFTSCPLCGFAVFGENSIDAVLHDKSLPPPNDKLWSHISAHLQSIAIMSLPWQDNVDDASSGHTESSRARTSTFDGGFESQSATSEENYSMAEEMGEDTSTYDYRVPSGPTNSAQKDEWSFLPRPYYCGQDRDPVLQNFLQKLYLESSPDTNPCNGPTLPCHMMPFNHSQSIFGREAVLEAIQSVLCPPYKAEHINPKGYINPRTFAVCGPGGMGKTQVAIGLVTRNVSLFDAVFWVHADEKSKIAQDFKDIAVALGLVALDSVDAKDLNHITKVVKAWLSNPLKSSGKNDKGNQERATWLLVFDGADDSEVLNDFWPYNGPGSILITSRNSLSWTASLQLGPFTAEEATNFLLNLTEREDKADEWQNAFGVASRLGGLPLALTQMAGIMRRRQLSFVDFLKAYEARESQEELLESHVDNYRHSVAFVWALENLTHGAALLQVLSMLDPDGIPERLLTSNMQLGPKGFPQSKFDYLEARTELLQSSLITRDKDTSKIFVHRLVQDVARIRMTPFHFSNIFTACVHMTSSVWPYAPFTWRHGIARWSECEELFAHVLRLKFLSEGAVETFSDCQDEYVFAKLLTDAGWYHHERGHSAESVTFYDKAELICRSLKSSSTASLVKGKEATATEKQVDSILAEIQHNRGCIATETNRPGDALRYHALFNSMMLKELGNQAHIQDMRPAISWNELGNAHMLNDNWIDGERCFIQSINAMREIEGFAKTWISLPLVNLALAYWLMHRLDEALKVLMEGLADREASFGPDDRESFITGRFLHALGNVKASQGNLDESLSYHRRALFQYRSTLGTNHHRTADIRVKVADHCIRLKQEKTAMALLDHALAVYGDRDFYKPEKARVKFKRSRVLRSLGKVEEAEAELQESMELFRDVVPEDVRPATSLTDSDFDRVIVFWSK